MKPQIVYQDDALIAVNKPAGWIVNKADTTGTNPVLQSWLIEEKFFKDYLPTSVSDFEKRSGIVHRLDKPTSGILLVAKDKESFENLQKQFKEREIKKEYLALVHGWVDPSLGNIKASIGRLPWNRERFGVHLGGRDSETDYETKSYYLKNGDKYSLVVFRPKTGRTHQIRVHAKHINHPIVSDMFYAGRKTSRKDMKWCKRLFLHALTITLKHPQTLKTLTLEAPLAKDLSDALSVLENVPAPK